MGLLWYEKTIEIPLDETMLNRLFGGTSRPSSEADLRSKFLLHGVQGYFSPNRVSVSTNIVSRDVGQTHGIGPGAHDIRLVIAQDLGDKSKVVLFDSQDKHNNGRPPGQSSSATATSTKPSTPPSLKNMGTGADLITELMFGTVPLSYKGTSARLHPLPVESQDIGKKRSFLFTKVFSVDFVDLGAQSPAGTNSGNTSLSSSYQSVSGKNEYPFPAMTPIMDCVSPSERPRTHVRDQCERSTSRGVRNPGPHHQRQASGSIRPVDRALTMTSKNHEKQVSGMIRADVGDAAPHMPFTRTEQKESFEDYFSGWCPSPGPYLSRRRVSVETAVSTSPGPHSHGNNTRHQSATCAVGIIFTVPGDGQEQIECLIMTRYWQMITRATYAMQRVIYDEIESALGLVASHGTAQLSRSRGRKAHGEARVYQRGKKYYVALGQECLQSNMHVVSAVDSFKARLTSGVNLPEIQRQPLEQECETLVDELQLVMQLLDKKECKFLFSVLISHLHKFVANIAGDGTAVSRRRSGGLSERFLVLSDNTVLARRLIYCIARIFFRTNPSDLHAAVDYSLVWPSGGLLGTPRKDLLKRRQCSLAKATRLHTGWDIPGNRPFSSSSVPAWSGSPLFAQRPSSNSSNVSSKNSSWKPSWTWFSNGSRSRLAADEVSRCSDQRTMQTSWGSTDFHDLGRSMHSRSSVSQTQTLPKFKANESSDSEDETFSDCVPLSTIGVAVERNTDGTIEVGMVDTVSLFEGESVRLEEVVSPAHSEFPLTGLLSRFHPDMFLQAIPHATYVEEQVKNYLDEEEMYAFNLSASTSSACSKATVGITIIEAGHQCRMRKLTRTNRPVSPVLSSTGAVPYEGWDESDESHASSYEHEWHDEVMTDINERLVSMVYRAVEQYNLTKDKVHIQRMIQSLSDSQDA